MLFLLTLFACKKPAPPETTPEPAPEQAEAPVDKVGAEPTGEGELPAHVDLKAHMGVHLGVATTARDAVIRGDLQAARQAMGWLAEHDGPEELPEEWQSYQPHILSMNQHAKAGSQAPTLEAAAVAIAGVAGACGGCHADAGAGPSFDMTDPPAEREGITPHMARHQWASEQLWAGLVSNSEPHWEAGAAALVEDPLEYEELHKGTVMNPEEKKFDDWLHTMGAFSAHVEDRQQRAELYGAMISTCSGCHSEMGLGPGVTTPDR